MAQELLDVSALSFQGRGKHGPKALNLSLDFLTKRSRFQKHLQLAAWQCSPCSTVTRPQTNILCPQNTVGNGKVLREGMREHGREEQTPPVVLSTLRRVSRLITQLKSPRRRTDPLGWVSPPVSRGGSWQGWQPHGRRGGGCHSPRWHELGAGCEHYIQTGENPFLVN